MKNKNERIWVEVARKRIPLKKLLHGKEIREAAANLENFRLHFNEQEIMLGATLTIAMDTYGEALLVSRRKETDRELADRIERQRKAEEEKAERARKRELREKVKAAEAEERARINAVRSIKNIILSNGLTAEDLAKMGVV